MGLGGQEVKIWSQIWWCFFLYLLPPWSLTYHCTFHYVKVPKRYKKLLKWTIFIFVFSKFPHNRKENVPSLCSLQYRYPSPVSWSLHPRSWSSQTTSRWAAFTIMAQSPSTPGWRGGRPWPMTPGYYYPPTTECWPSPGSPWPTMTSTFAWWKILSAAGAAFLLSSLYTVSKRINIFSNIVYSC